MGQKLIDRLKGKPPTAKQQRIFRYFLLAYALIASGTLLWVACVLGGRAQGLSNSPNIVDVREAVGLATSGVALFCVGVMILQWPASLAIIGMVRWLRRRLLPQTDQAGKERIG